jgi:integrase
MPLAFHTNSLTQSLLDPIEAEFAKDIWDVRHLPGVRFNQHQSQYLLSFTQLPLVFRPLVKGYLKFLLTQRSLSSGMKRLQYLTSFTQFFHKAYPQAYTFKHLNRADIEAYLLHLKTTPTRYGKPISGQGMSLAVGGLEQFLQYLERCGSPQAPSWPIGRLIWPEDRGSPTGFNRSGLKYIPETVLQQLEAHLDKLPAVYLPVALVLRASGWRISDVLNLRYDQCLERTSSGWWLCGDILKTQVLHHRIPISDEIAAVLTAQVEQVKAKYGEEDNPQHFLFPGHTSKRKGRSLYGRSLQRALNQLIAQQEIKDEQGNIFHLKLHAFRHTKAVELINNGMSLAHVQKWLAHHSPEMTLAYAQILDPTLRQEWEKAFAKGAVRIDQVGLPRTVPCEQLTNENEIEWEYIRHNLDAVRLPNGYCFKPKKAECPTQAIPCYSCHNFCTTPDFLTQFEKEEQDTLELIELGHKTGSVPWVERNSQKLGRLHKIIQLLHKGELHHPAGKSLREYTKSERERMGQKDGQQ